MKIITLQIKFKETDFKKLQNCKEEGKINKECENWEDYILKLAGVKK